MKKEHVLTALILSSLFFAVNCGKTETSGDTLAPVAEVENVETVTVTKSSIEDFYEATGTVKAKTTTKVSANTMGRIISIPFSEGDRVSRGEVLIKLDNRESMAQMQKAQGGLKEAQAKLVEIEKSAKGAKAGVKTAEANKELAEKTFARYRELHKRGSASANEFDVAQSNLKTAVSELDRAKANVETILSQKKQVNANIERARAEIANTKIYQDYSRIVSPVSGVIVKKFAEVGAIATPGSPLISIEDNSMYLLEAAVEESRSQLIQTGNRVNVRIDALGEGEMTGSVTEILPMADAASRSYTVKISLPVNPLLKSGLYGLARFPVSGKEAITVPQTAIIQRGQLTGVVVGKDGIAQFRIVTTGKTSEGMVEVLSGISEGDRIVTSDADKLADGVKIK
ncbi:MAG: efflux RND transporter periplasmic adaptor subunit [Acidobacteriota bacterium]|nr:efflux RND transporter periplasmic adaptor subunit [Acidobacteriota bacterium]